jgi:hypothetical protein
MPLGNMLQPIDEPLAIGTGDDLLALLEIIVGLGRDHDVAAPQTP